MGKKRVNENNKGDLVKEVHLSISRKWLNVQKKDEN